MRFSDTQQGEATNDSTTRLSLARNLRGINALMQVPNASADTTCGTTTKKIVASFLLLGRINIIKLFQISASLSPLVSTLIPRVKVNANLDLLLREWRLRRIRVPNLKSDRKADQSQVNKCDVLGTAWQVPCILFTVVEFSCRINMYTIRSKQLVFFIHENMRSCSYS
jgi:hypothetical protein